MFISVQDPPTVLTQEEQTRLLEAVAREGSRRDLALLTLALRTPDLAGGPYRRTTNLRDNVSPAASLRK
jgi:hypothetical protein